MNNKTIDYKAIHDQVCDIAKLAGDFIRSERRVFDLEKVEHKGKFDLVSYVDKGSEVMVVEKLGKLVEGATFITEEGTVEQKRGQYVWVIDPLDGTTNFVHDFSPYCVSLALMEGDKVVVGVVYEITRDECFSAYEGGVAMLNGEVIKVSRVGEVENSLVLTGFSSKASDEAYSKSADVFNFFNRNTHGVRRLGSAAADLVYIAVGRGEAFYHCGLSPWDVAAGALIVQMAGGKVTDFKGGSDFVFGREVIASNGLKHDYFQKHLNSF